MIAGLFGSPPPPPPSPPEALTMLPIALAIGVCWLGPVLLTYLASAMARSQKADNAANAKGKTCVVIGASTGIGLELCKQLAARGSKVYGTVRKPNAELSAIKGVTVVPGIDVTSDGVGAALASSALAGVTIDILVHNAGSFDAGLVKDKSNIGALFASQKLGAVTSESMKAVFDVNTLGPLRVAQALHGQLAEPSKLAIISTQLGSIDDNNSGGSYAYRASKAAVNMVGKSLSCDLKGKNVSVQMLAPGFVATNFGPGAAGMKKMGAKDVTPSVEGVVEALDAMSMANTGTFVHCNYGLGLKNSLW